MIIFPAIDLLEGNCVRLTKGDFDKSQIYSSDPCLVADKFADYGASWLHVVDLNGARGQGAQNYSIIKALCKKGRLKLQTGGGIRSLERISELLELGVSRVILGTKAVKDPDFLKSALSIYGDKIAVGVDAKEGMVATDGWEKLSSIESFGFCSYLYELGVKTIIYTDISKDGAMAGTNMNAFSRLSEISGLKVIASGGICSYEEISALNEMGIYGAIIGKALYEGVIDIAQAIERANITRDKN